VRQVGDEPRRQGRGLPLAQPGQAGILVTAVPFLQIEVTLF
jgi:hypothetical protein